MGEEGSGGWQVVLKEGPNCLSGEALPHDMGLLSSCAWLGIQEIGHCPPTRASTPQTHGMPPSPWQPTQHETPPNLLPAVVPRQLPHMGQTRSQVLVSTLHR